MDFINRSSQFKAWMKKMAAQVNLFCFLMFFFCLACNMVPENWHICVNKGITYFYYYLDLQSNPARTRNCTTIRSLTEIPSQPTQQNLVTFSLKSNVVRHIWWPSKLIDYSKTVESYPFKKSMFKIYATLIPKNMPWVCSTCACHKCFSLKS